eukprot:TRINITY_DN50629_c0_g1_i1.p1 TRINITY_DN50629_c0_g1~~TRINITY_DN50629_c0_g1_i1.p1  ORF type:complete len:231 (+),score=18.89 TRINITY_DN50629_c0_g1_i1:28-720(+)
MSAEFPRLCLVLAFFVLCLAVHPPAPILPDVWHVKGQLCGPDGCKDKRWATGQFEIWYDGNSKHWRMDYHELNGRNPNGYLPFHQHSIMNFSTVPNFMTGFFTNDNLSNVTKCVTASGPVGYMPLFGSFQKNTPKKYPWKPTYENGGWFGHGGDFPALEDCYNTLKFSSKGIPEMVDIGGPGPCTNATLHIRQFNTPATIPAKMFHLPKACLDDPPIWKRAEAYAHSGPF